MASDTLGCQVIVVPTLPRQQRTPRLPGQQWDPLCHVNTGPHICRVIIWDPHCHVSSGPTVYCNTNFLICYTGFSGYATLILLFCNTNFLIATPRFLFATPFLVLCNTKIYKIQPLIILYKYIYMQSATPYKVNCNIGE